MTYNPSYTLQQPTPSPSSEPALSRSTPTPPTPLSGEHSSLPFHLPPIRIPSSHYNNRGGIDDFQQQNRHSYPTSSPYNHPLHSPLHPPILHPTSASPSEPTYNHTSSNNSMSSSSRTRLPPLTSTPPTSYFSTGYASPATSTYSSEPGSRDEIDMIDSSGTLGTHSSNGPYHGQTLVPGADGMIIRGEGGMCLDTAMENSQREQDCRRWSMKDFTLIQTVGSYPVESK
jgi:hypothetical protein